jgi:hypothetical protein
MKNSVLYLAVGMPRAGSGWHYNLMHDLVVAGGGSDAREIRQRFLLGAVLTEINLNIRSLSPTRLALAQAPILLGNSYTIKTHSMPTKAAKRLLDEGKMRASYIYRDPRAALLSALEYGKRARKADRHNAFSQLESFEDGLAFMLGYLKIWKNWMDVEEVHHLRYEDLQSNFEKEAGQVAEFLQLDVEKSAVSDVISQHHPKQASSDRKGQHFQFGEAERFRKVFSKVEIKQANAAFIDYLELMGYSA